jgi:hypothetical protein
MRTIFKASAESLLPHRSLQHSFQLAYHVGLYSTAFIQNREKYVFRTAKKETSTLLLTTGAWLVFPTGKNAYYKTTISIISK